jgi:hypothetical protein
VEEKVFGTSEGIITALEKYDDNTLAHVSILTHGTPYSIITGSEDAPDAGELAMFDPRCTEMARLLQQKLRIKASVLLCACNTGKITPLITPPEVVEPGLVRKIRMTRGIQEDMALTLLTFRNWCYPNFASMLALRLRNHAVFCTPNEQHADELVVKYIGRCRDVAPLIYFSRNQTMFRYLHNSTGCETYPPELDSVSDTIFGGGAFKRLDAGEQPPESIARVKGLLRAYEKNTDTRCNDTRRGINAVINTVINAVIEKNRNKNKY